MKKIFFRKNSSLELFSPQVGQLEKPTPTAELDIFGGLGGQGPQTNGFLNWWEEIYPIWYLKCSINKKNHIGEGPGS